MSDLLDQLVDMTRYLGQPHLDYVILGEGNTSYRIDDETFYIKASGQQMHNISQSGFVAVHLAPILSLFDDPASDKAQAQQIIDSSKVDIASPLKPSIEVSFHAMLLADCAVRCIAHTHPVAVNRILCSTRAEQFALNRLFPDEAVVCGPQSVFVPYADPGLPLAQAIYRKTHEFMDKFGAAPAVILLANHGLIALAQTPTEALSITAMCVKAAKIFAGACAVGEPVFMSEADIMHIWKRPDEIYRRQQFTQAEI